MGLYYQTEYRLGRRGRVFRNYTGIKAFLAIGFDLCFLLMFDFLFAMLFFGLRTILRLSTKVLSAVAYTLSVPFRLARWASLELQRRITTVDERENSRSPLKPAWNGFDEV